MSKQRHPRRFDLRSPNMYRTASFSSSSSVDDGLIARPPPPPRAFDAEVDSGDDGEASLGFADCYTHYDDIDPYTCESLQPEQYLICDYRVWAFVLKTRRWGKTTC